MTTPELAQTTLEEVLAKMGFTATITQEYSSDGLCLQMTETPYAELLIGEDGDRLDDLQYLVNRFIQKKDKSANRIRIDCMHYRANREKKLAEKAINLAKKVQSTGKSIRLEPLNAYYRRIVHNALVDMPEIQTESPRTTDRYKRITISKKS